MAEKQKTNTVQLVPKKKKSVTISNPYAEIEVDFDSALLEIHWRVTWVRTTLNLTQREFAQRLGVHRNTVANIEKGLSPLTLKMLYQLEKEYDIPSEFLVSGKTRQLTPANKDRYISFRNGRILHERMAAEEDGDV